MDARRVHSLGLRDLRVVMFKWNKVYEFTPSAQVVMQHAGLNWIYSDLRNSSGAQNRRSNAVGHCAPEHTICEK